MDTTIIITIIITLLGIIGYFINRYFISIDSAVKQFQASVSKLDLAVSELTLMTRSISSGCQNKHDKIDNTLSAHDTKIQELILIAKQSNFRIDEILKNR